MGERKKGRDCPPPTMYRMDRELVAEIKGLTVCDCEGVNGYVVSIVVLHVHDAGLFRRGVSVGLPDLL